MNELKKLIKDGYLNKINLVDFLKVIVKIANTYIDVQEEVKDWDCIIQVHLLDHEPIWIKIANAKFSFGFGSTSETKLTLTMAKEKFIKIFLRLIDMKQDYLKGELNVKGNLEDLARFGQATEIIFEELEEILK